MVERRYVNERFIRELIKEIGRDVILFGADGMSYFGNLISMSKSGIALLGPAVLSSTGMVEIQNPAEVSAVLNMTNIDLAQIVGMGIGLTADPFVLPPDNTEALSGDETGVPATGGVDLYGNQSYEQAYSGEHQTGELSDLLWCKLGKFVTLGTYGGYLFAGNLIYLEDRTAKVNIDYLFAPGGDGNTLFGITYAVVNLLALTSVSS